LTGQLGEVMKESATAALSFIRANAGDLGIPVDFFEENDIHIHVPAGAIPKDGTISSVTMLTALASLLTGKTVKKDLAMTGEITLRGLVLPVGGIKEKVLAAHRAGIKTIILPKWNKKDLVDIPQKVQKDMQFYFVDDMLEVLKLALRNDESFLMILTIHPSFSIRYRWEMPPKTDLDRTTRKPCLFIMSSNAFGTGNPVTESRRYR